MFEGQIAGYAAIKEHFSTAQTYETGILQQKGSTRFLICDKAMVVVENNSAFHFEKHFQRQHVAYVQTIRLLKILRRQQPVMYLFDSFTWIAVEFSWFFIVFSTNKNLSPGELYQPLKPKVTYFKA